MRLKELETQLAIADKQLQSVQACSSNPNCTVVVGGPAVNVNAK
ncbi:hypothetical protein [Micromonospora sp. SL4-19]